MLLLLLLLLLLRVLVLGVCLLLLLLVLLKLLLGLLLLGVRLLLMRRFGQVDGRSLAWSRGEGRTGWWVGGCSGSCSEVACCLGWPD